MTNALNYAKLDAWIDAHFDEEVRYLQALVQVPTDTPPGNNAPHAERTAELLAAMGPERRKARRARRTGAGPGHGEHHQPDRAPALCGGRPGGGAQCPR